MKQLSFFLFVATGLILCTSLSAQQYHDALAFGLKGNVKECKVLDAEGGSERLDPFSFYSLSFSRDGKLTAWNDHMDNFFDVVRSGGLLTGIKQKEVLTEAVTEYRFRYRNGTVVGYYILCNEVSSILGPRQETEVVDIWADKGDGIFYSDITSYYTISDELSSFIDDQFTRDNPKFYNDETYGGDCSSFDECRILKSDSHGNYVLLDKEDLLGNSLSYRLYGTSTTRIKRIITYWDDEPASNYSITSTAPGIKLSTSKELTLKDLISKPLGVIENPSKSLWGIDPEKVIEYTQENKEWKCTESYGIYGIKEGFNWTFKGYPLDVDVRKYKYVNYSYGYGYYVTMGYKDQETKEAASREMEKLFNIVVQEFRDLGIELTQSQGKSWIRAEKTIGDMHYLVALNKPVEIDGKVLNQEYYVSIGIDKPL